MLNELSLVVDAIERMGITPTLRHRRINPMGKNKSTLIVSLDDNGVPVSVEFISGEVGGALFRVEHGSAGSSFPGFNIPVPLRDLSGVASETVAPLIEKFFGLAKNKKTDSGALADAMAALLEVSSPSAFTPAQEKQFQRSCVALVEELHTSILPVAKPALGNFITLIKILKKTPPSLTGFAEKVAHLLATPKAAAIPFSRVDLVIIQKILFGVLDLKKRAVAIGTSAYWKEKAKQDKGAAQPVYLDIAIYDTALKRVAHSGTSALLNDALVAAGDGVCEPQVPERKAPASTKKKTKAAASSGADWGLDAFSGEYTRLQDKYPTPKIAELGNVMLFSVNAREVPTLYRYGLAGSATFPAAAARVQKMNDSLLFLASDERRGSTCIAIPGAQSGKKDLLVAYLENDIADEAATSSSDIAIAEMFGGETEAFSDAGFAARTQAVLNLFKAKLNTNPDLSVRLLALGAIDKGRKQASLNRTYRADAILKAAEEWNEAARNIPRITIRAWDKESKKFDSKTPRGASPVDLVSTINRVWSSASDGGFSCSPHRAFSVADAYDIFIPDAPVLAEQKTRLALSLLLSRMATVLAALGAVKTTRDEKYLSDTVRCQSLKTLSLIGLLLKKINPTDNTRIKFMKEPLYQLGQMLALADSLHQQYCIHVRDNQMPSQLIGNALFNTALEQPVFALARLAERLVPYQAWARTFDPPKGYPKKYGWEKVILGKMRECTARFIEDVNGTFRIRTDEFPAHMTDEDKAKLLLGYLADIYEPKAPSGPPDDVTSDAPGTPPTTTQSIS